MKLEIDFEGDFKELILNHVEQTILVSIVELLINKGKNYIIIFSRDGWEILWPNFNFHAESAPAICVEAVPHFYRKNGGLFIHNTIIAEMGITFMLAKKCLEQLFDEFYPRNSTLSEGYKV